MSNLLSNRLFFCALDPVHIGAGGYRLGRVDLTIVREPGTNVPKIPGTSLAGAARAYAAMVYQRPEAAGQHKKIESDKRKEFCPILYTFGTTLDSGAGEAHGTAGTVSMGDAQILFFPVYSRFGPVWITTPELLTAAGFVYEPPDLKLGDEAATTLPNVKQKLNLGWLLLGVPKPVRLTKTPKALTNSKGWKAIQQRIVIVEERLFSHAVNSGLEVRTSVSIDPFTGAAESGALFTYEAIPRTTWLFAEGVEDDYRVKEKERKFPVKQDFRGQAMKTEWTRPMDVLAAGLGMMRLLGVGGMGTRGFGRLDLVGAEALDGQS